MADSPQFFKAVSGITDGMAHHPAGEVFPSTDTLASHYDATGGKNGDEVLYEPATEQEFKEYSVTVTVTTGDLVREDGSIPLGTGAPSGFDVVGGGAYENITSNNEAVDGPKVTTQPDGTPLAVPVGTSVDDALKKADDAAKAGEPITTAAPGGTINAPAANAATATYGAPTTVDANASAATSTPASNSAPSTPSTNP